MTRNSLWQQLFRPLRLWFRYWPQLAACYLLGLLARRATIELAAWAGYAKKPAHKNTWGFDAAQLSRLTASLQAEAQFINTTLRYQLRILRARAPSSRTPIPDESSIAIFMRPISLIAVFNRRQSSSVNSSGVFSLLPLICARFAACRIINCFLDISNEKTATCRPSVSA